MIEPAPLPLSGPSVTMRALVARVAELERDISRPVLLVGARGLGKRYLAQRIHRASELADQPFVIVEARALSDDGLRDAVRLAAPRSTLLVRHVEQLSASAQVLLDQLTGTRGPIVRLMATTTADIVAQVTAGAFLEQLYYRLHAWPMLLPSLADRTAEDLLALATAVLEQTADGDAELPTALDASALHAISAFAWPENLRELEAVLALAQLRARGESAVTSRRLSLHQADPAAPAAAASLADLERWHLLRALQLFRGNRTHAARSLGISRMTLIAKLKLFGDDSV